jgi:NAD(P)H-flavin reductase
MDCYHAPSVVLRKIRGNLIEVRFKKPRAFQYNLGQYVRIAVPKLTAFSFILSTYRQPRMKKLSRFTFERWVTGLKSLRI